MTIAIVCNNKDTKPWYEALKAVDGSLDIQIWPDKKNRDDVFASPSISTW